MLVGSILGSLMDASGARFVSPKRRRLSAADQGSSEAEYRSAGVLQLARSIGEYAKREHVKVFTAVAVGLE